MTYAISTDKLFFMNTTGNIFPAISPAKKVPAKVAVDRAYAIFAQNNPEWIDSLFDQNFIDQKIKPIVAHKHENGRTISALDVAMTWDSQFSIQTLENRQKHMTALVVGADTFVRELNKQLA